ncbi:MAG: DUF1848 domain-containing protein [Spirochaetaceae bacterium]|nr:MAG: DUF1848 domain-containing protein [Spirochaetaceae bacterium]
MIISASRRTDIPAFYGPWLLRRLREGYALVRNPVNPRLVYHIPISAGKTRCIVFWTKNPATLIGRLGELEDFGIPFYFLFTLNGYGSELERNLPDKEQILRTFVSLARLLGPERVVWRYDPIVFTRDYPPSAHLRLFGILAQKLRGLTRRCVASYLTMYNKCRRNLQSVQILEIPADRKAELAAGLKSLAATCGIELVSCACSELAEAGVPAGKCIDDALVASVSGQAFSGKKDRSQRGSCLCVESADIGAYDTCLHNCLYCYANSSYHTAVQRHRLHDPRSPLLFGRLGEQDQLLERTG